MKIRNKSKYISHQTRDHQKEQNQLKEKYITFKI